MASINWIYLLYINLFLLIILFVQLGYLIIQKIIDNKREQRKKNLIEKIGPTLREHLFEGKPFQTRILQDDPIFFEVLEELLGEYNELLKDSGIKINELAEKYLTKYYEKRFTHKRWSIRMNTLYHIEDFQLTTFENDLLQRLKSNELKNEVERYQIIRTLATLQSPIIVDEILANNVLLPKSVYKELLRRLNEEYFKFILTKFHQLDQNGQVAVLEYIGELKALQYLELVEQQLNHDELEVRLSSLKVLTLFGYIGNIDRIIPFSSSDIWQERMYFARISGTLKKERFKPYLVKLISDANWFVRNTAGESLYKYKDGIYILQHIASTHEDPYAKDTATQWLESGEELL